MVGNSHDSFLQQPELQLGGGVRLSGRKAELRRSRRGNACWLFPRIEHKITQQLNCSSSRPGLSVYKLVVAPNISPMLTQTLGAEHTHTRMNVAINTGSRRHAHAHERGNSKLAGGTCLVICFLLFSFFAAYNKQHGPVYITQNLSQ